MENENGNEILSETSQSKEEPNIPEKIEKIAESQISDKNIIESVVVTVGKPDDIEKQQNTQPDMEDQIIADDIQQESTNMENSIMDGDSEGGSASLEKPPKDDEIAGESELKDLPGSVPLQKSLEDDAITEESELRDLPGSVPLEKSLEDDAIAGESEIRALPGSVSSEKSSEEDATVGKSEQKDLSESDNANKTAAESARSATLKASDNRTLNENISNKSEELMHYMMNPTDESDEVQMKTVEEKEKTTEAKKGETKGENLHIDSLRLLAQYNSDSDDDDDEENDDVVEVPLEGNTEYRNRIVEIQSESESSSSEDSDVEYLTTIRKEIQKCINSDDDEDDDDEDGEGNKKKKKQSQMRVKGEMLLDDLPPIHDLHITVPEQDCIELGQVHSIIDQLLLVSVKPNSLLLDLDTVLFLDKGQRVLGEVFDVLGQVADPQYCVRFNTHKEIEDKGIKIGDIVYVAPKTKYTQFVILSSLMKLRGSDASWENDIEPPPRYLDYSDDEQEREARASLRNKDRPNDHDDQVKRSRSNDHDDESDRSSTSVSASPSANSQRSGRFNRARGGQSRSPFQQQPQHQHRNQLPHNTPYPGSWHSNYNSVRSYNHEHMMHQQMPGPVPPHYPFPPPRAYGPPPHFPPAIRSPAPPPMYVLNPMAMTPIGMPNNRTQHQPPSQPNRARPYSPPPAPPGLD